MRLIDTHAHLDFDAFAADRDALIATLDRHDIGVLNPATDEESVAAIDRLTRAYPNVWGAVGLHPTEITNDVLLRLPEMLRSWALLLDRNPKLVAVGEIGLDYYHQKDSAAIQKAALRSMLTFAQERNLPVIFHCRDAYGDLITLLGNYPKIRGVIHCFGGSSAQAEQFLDLGLFLSFTCNVTYPKNAELRATIAALPLDRLMVETDAPFLAPHELRGQRNDPTNLARVIEVIAAEQKIDAERVAQQTTANAKKMFTIET